MTTLSPRELGGVAKRRGGLVKHRFPLRARVLRGCAMALAATSLAGGLVVNGGGAGVSLASVPTAPSMVTATRGIRSAILSWHPPTADHGSPITAYIVTRYYHGVAQQKTYASTKLTTVVPGLAIGRPFTFRVAAKNGFGVGPESPASNETSPAGPIRPNTPPPAGGYFKTSPPGAVLPTGTTCAGRVHYSPWEPRKDNRTDNRRTPTWPAKVRNHPDFNSTFNAKFRPRITGDFTGTTDEIIQWASCKWGISDDIIRAEAVDESEWHMNVESDYEHRSAGHCAAGDTRDPCPTSFGILQIKWYYNPDPNRVTGSYPMSKNMTAFSLDYTLAWLRGCYEGWEYFGTKTRGDLLGCMGAWYSGGWHDSGANEYISRVRGFYATKPWRHWAS